jgi:hypothetical protein
LIRSYLDTNGDRLLKTVTQFGSGVRYALGFQQIETEMPVMDGVLCRVLIERRSIMNASINKSSVIV